jgi:hypothetical protein
VIFTSKNIILSLLVLTSGIYAQADTLGDVQAKGSRPRAIRQQQFEYAYIFGAACPAKDKA